MTAWHLSLFGLVLAWMPAEAQGVPGTNLSVTVNVVALTRTGDTTHVSYILRNSSTSQERVLALTIEMPTKPLHVVGVDPLPSEATSKSLTTRLDSLTGRACTLGWITQTRLCGTLRGHLTARPPQILSFRRALAAGHTSGGPVTDNAYWLLKVNADYILSAP